MEAVMDEAPRRALVVEDEPLILEMALQVVDELGHVARGCTTAEEALEILEAMPRDFDLVLTDIGLAGKRSGLDLVREVSRRWPWVRMVVVSGHVYPAEDALPQNACFLMKPWQPLDLIKAVVGGSRKGIC
jgi:CheY-like chemotaxis protein